MKYEKIAKYFSKIDKTNYLHKHIDRLTKSYLFLEPELKDNINILDLGSYGHFTKGIENFNNTITTCVSSFDLRYKSMYSDEDFDLICCMEVLEHIKDRDSDDLNDIAIRKETGVLSLLCEINRILKPEGKLFLTTPNMSTLLSVIRILNYENPNFFLPHVKEYSINELTRLLNTCGFEVERLITENVWGEYSIENYDLSKLELFCYQNGFSLSNRGDDIFLIAKKIREAKEILYKTEYFTVTKSMLFS